MTALTTSAHRPGLHHVVPGLVLTGIITGFALWLAGISVIQSLSLGALTLAILCGMVVGNTLYPRIEAQCGSGVLFAKQYLLRLGIILYGFRLTFSQIAEVGMSGLVIDIIMLTSTFTLACWLGQKVFGLDKQTSWLIGAGSSICGAAAILATEPVVKADAIVDNFPCS